MASFGKPIILSTGMNTLESVRKAAAIFESAGTPYALMHTTNCYPTPLHLMAAVPDAVVGLSDQTTRNVACLRAVALRREDIQQPTVEFAAQDALKSCLVRYCPKCRSANLRLSPSRSAWETWRKRLTAKRTYRCRACAWRGWGVDSGPCFDDVTRNAAAKAIAAEPANFMKAGPLDEFDFMSKHRRD